MVSKAAEHINSWLCRNAGDASTVPGALLSGVSRLDTADQTDAVAETT